MNCDQVKNLIDDYIDDKLSLDENIELEKHINTCTRCSELLFSLRALQERISNLPDKIEPPENLWDEIFKEVSDLRQKSLERDKKKKPEKEPEEELILDDVVLEKSEAPPKKSKKEKVKNTKIKLRTYNPNRKKIYIALFFLIIVAAAVLYFARYANNWYAFPVSGTPRIDSGIITERTRFAKDEKLSTNKNAEADITIPEIGKIELLKNSAVIRNDEENTLTLLSGGIKRYSGIAGEYLTVSVPGASVRDYDLGSGYELNIFGSDSTVIVVNKGKEIISFNDNNIIVPADYGCIILKNAGAGIPYRLNASLSFKHALYSFSFGYAKEEDFNLITDEAKKGDELSLFYLLERSGLDLRKSLYRLLKTFTSPPPGVTEKGIVVLNQNMLHKWRDEILRGM